MAGLLNRRVFLGASLAAAAPGQGLPGKIRAGILGIQHSHLTGKLQAMYDHPDYQVVAVCEPGQATRKQRGGEKLLQPLRWMSMDEMLGDASLNLIVFEGEVKDAIPFGMREIGRAHV